jgi:hypothetical protein
LQRIDLIYSYYQFLSNCYLELAFLSSWPQHKPIICISRLPTQSLYWWLLKSNYFTSTNPRQWLFSEVLNSQLVLYHSL